MRGMRGYANALASLVAFFAGVTLEGSGAAFHGLDGLVAVLFAGGAAAGFYGYARGAATGGRRIALAGASLDVIALILHIVLAL